MYCISNRVWKQNITFLECAGPPDFEGKVGLDFLNWHKLINKLDAPIIEIQSK